MTQINATAGGAGKDDDLLHRIDEQTADAGPAEPADTLEKRLRLLLPGSAMFRSIQDDGLPKALNVLTGGKVAEWPMFEVKWTTPHAEWKIMFIDDHGAVTGGVICRAADDAGGVWKLHEVSRDTFLDVLCAVGAITTKR